MRKSGMAEDARGFGRHDHLCWSYTSGEEFTARAREFLVEGLELGQRICFVGAENADPLRGVAAIEAALASGAVQVIPQARAYPNGEVVDPADQVRTYATATQEAIDAGYTGLRVAAEATPLVRTPEQLNAFLRYEHLIDRYMASHPFSAMCGYDSTALDDHAVARLTAAHPTANRPGQFRLHAPADGGCAAELSGELDLYGHDLLAALLECIDPRPTDGELVLHAPELDFIDHRGLMVLAAHAQRHDATLVLRTRWPGAARVVSVLGLPHVRVEAIA
ncbi:MEDS domain-containing protein [Allokutzneria sp. A3M-2-11 16]|uniref:MEDS domain-containing protein n=1 Tax=Allokutzneria sp. A3M-2-11 16 TaxID=2962043 RepID=UPI0020B77144|nr:MEDS domain-containing protein [Allokutzneria sp. A3M-2-11 16]MCP3802362.1 MEDS domain-containing protein [Allokutzneria sp. A3M-2-11 16]